MFASHCASLPAAAFALSRNTQLPRALALSPPAKMAYLSDELPALIVQMFMRGA
jgi:hypothetical protein